MTATLDTAGFLQNLFMVQLSTVGPNNQGGDFPSYAAAIGYSTMNDGPLQPGDTAGGTAFIPGSPGLDPTMTAIFSELGDNAWLALPEYFSKGKCRDTSLGGNDAVNCYPQFNETDDVAEHPFLSTITGDPTSGMGRVYSETYDDMQQIMYITFGVPKYNNLVSFYGNAILPDLAKVMNNGAISAGSSLGRLFGIGIAAFIKLPTLPLVFIGNILGGLTSVPITKYYDFQSAMPLYYRCVNSMMLHIAINMGLNKDQVLIPGGSSLQSGGSISSLSPDEQAADAVKTANGTPTRGMPEIFDQYGPDIYKILLRKYNYMSGGYPCGTQDSENALMTPSAELEAVINVDTSGSTFANNFFTAFASQLYDATLYVGFRIEKGVDTSESFTNETGESSIAQTINAKAAAGRDAKFSAAGGNIGSGIIGTTINAMIEGIGGVLSGAASAIGLGSIENILAGNGVVDFPDVWKSSSFSKSYTFNMSLRSPYGDPTSILQNLYIPLSMLLAGAMPRAVGQSAYTAPFVCRAYCKGMFAVPLGMISHMTIKRGADQFGWNTSRLPTCIDISFEIKDLSPAMYLAIGDGGTLEAIKQVFSANSTFQEYLMTLSGMGLADRISWIRNLRRKANYLYAQFRSTKLSPFYWGATLGNTLPARMISNFLPLTRFPSN